jgi:hypothetical protein
MLNGIDADTLLTRSKKRLTALKNLPSPKTERGLESREFKIAAEAIWVCIYSVMKKVES